MRIFWLAICVAALQSFASGANAAPDCDPDKVLGVSRTIEIDTSSGPLFGTHQYGQTIDLAPGEVVLTFDDGPHPQYTKAVLSALERHCTKATFFAVGTMALAYPDTLKEVAKAGHTIGVHTYRHSNLRHLGFERGKRAIERGFAAILQANGQPVAPFFRFPYLSMTSRLQDYLGSRGIATFSVDIISGDTTPSRGSTIIRRTIRLLKEKKKGIILMHDLQGRTARALPGLLDTLKAGGYKVVHIVPRSTFSQAELSARKFVEQTVKQNGVVHVHRTRRTNATVWRAHKPRPGYRRRRSRDPDWAFDEPVLSAVMGW